MLRANQQCGHDTNVCTRCTNIGVSRRSRLCDFDLKKSWLLDRPYFDSADLPWAIAVADATKRIGIWLKETSVYTPHYSRVGPMDPLIGKAQDALSIVCNLTTGLAHPLDESRAKELFVALHARGIPLPRDEIQAHA